VVLLIEGISLYDFQAHESLFPAVTDIFMHRVEVITPLAYNGSLVEELAAVPLTGTQKHKLLNGELHHRHAFRHVSY
jgi:RNA exonuclease 1